MVHTSFSSSLLGLLRSRLSRCPNDWQSGCDSPAVRSLPGLQKPRPEHSDDVLAQDRSRDDSVRLRGNSTGTSVTFLSRQCEIILGELWVQIARGDSPRIS